MPLRHRRFITPSAWNCTVFSDDAAILMNMLKGKIDPGGGGRLVVVADERQRSTALVECFGGAKIVPLAAKFALRGRRAGTLFARAWFRPCQLLSLTREARFSDRDTGATGPFCATLAAISFALVRVSFPRPFILNHAATGTGR